VRGGIEGDEDTKPKKSFKKPVKKSDGGFAAAAAPKAPKVYDNDAKGTSFSKPKSFDKTSSKSKEPKEPHKPKEKPNAATIQVPQTSRIGGVWSSGIEGSIASSRCPTA
jgi:hypothetical protein